MTGEADILMNKHDPKILWTTDEATTCSTSNNEFNVDNVITHERGHSFGLADVTASGHENLTMWHKQPLSDIEGDVGAGRHAEPGGALLATRGRSDHAYAYGCWAITTSTNTARPVAAATATQSSREGLPRKRG